MVMSSVCRVKGLPVYDLLCLGFVVARVLYSTHLLPWEQDHVHCSVQQEHTAHLLKHKIHYSKRHLAATELWEKPPLSTCLNFEPNHFSCYNIYSFLPFSFNPLVPILLKNWLVTFGKLQSLRRKGPRECRMTRPNWMSWSRVRYLFHHKYSFLQNGTLIFIKWIRLKNLNSVIGYIFGESGSLRNL